YATCGGGAGRHHGWCCHHARSGGRTVGGARAARHGHRGWIRGLRTVVPGAGGHPRLILVEGDMRFLMLVIPKGYETAQPGTMPDAASVARMMKYNEELQKAGVLLALDGLRPPSEGARVSFSR